MTECTPLSLGVNIAGDRMSVIIPRYATIPCQMTRSYTSTYDNQTEVDIEVYEGKSSMIKDNYFLGKLTFTGLIPAPKGVPKIKVTFEIDWNGIRNVSAIETISGQKNKITIINQRGRCSLERIRKLIREAEPFKYDDERSAAAAEARNSLEQKCYDIKKWAAKCRSSGLAEKVKSRVEETLRWLESNPTASKEVYERKARELDLSF